MDLLLELAFILSKYSLKSLDYHLPKDSKLRRLFDGISKGIIHSDEEAAHFLYETLPSDKRYLMLKRNLINKLFELLLSSDLEVEKKIRKSKRKDIFNQEETKFLANQYLIIADKLLIQNVYHNAEKIIERVRQKAKEYHLIEIEWECVRKLRTIYALKGFANETEKYTLEAQALREEMIFLDNLKSYWEVMQAKTKFFIGQYSEWEAEAYAAEKLTETYRGNYYKKQQENEKNIHPLAKLYGFRFRNIRLLQSQPKLAELQKNTNEWQEHFQTYPHLNTPTRNLELLIAQIHTLRYAGNFLEALQLIKKATKLTTYQAFNKFQIQEFYFDTLLKINEPKHGYKQAALILLEVLETPQFERLDKWDKSSWRLREAYLFLILQYKDPKLTRKITPNFYQKNVLLELPDEPITKDKTGYNTIRIWIKLLFLFHTGMEDFVSEANNLRNYYHRHLKDSKDERLRQFILFLVKVAQNDFNPNFLEETKLKLPQKNYNSTEFGCYEKIEELVLNLLITKEQLRSAKAVKLTANVNY